MKRAIKAVLRSLAFYFVYFFDTSFVVLMRWKNMNQNDAFTSYLIKIVEEVFLHLRSKGATKEDAEDIIQNTFYKIYSMLSDLEEKTIRPWFYRVALYEFIDLKRKKEPHSKR